MELQVGYFTMTDVNFYGVITLHATYNFSVPKLKMFNIFSKSQVLCQE